MQIADKGTCVCKSTTKHYAINLRVCILENILRLGVSAKLHCTNTGYGHVVQTHQRTSSQQFYNLLYNKFFTNGQKFATFLTCRDVGLWHCDCDVANLLYNKLQNCCELVLWWRCTCP